MSSARIVYIASLCLAAPVLEAAPYDEAIRKGTKHHKWKKIVANGWNGRHLAEPLFCYRMHDANLSGIGKRPVDTAGAASLLAPLVVDPGNVRRVFDELFLLLDGAASQVHEYAGYKREMR